MVLTNSAYSLFNGVGKIQGKREGGSIPKAGQLVRLLSVPFIDTECFNGYEDGDSHARAIKRESKRYCGAAGREWIRWLTVILKWNDVTHRVLPAL
ncbi:hypothetical protein [Xenorhabdus sp. TS4]|uniref:hypothetical protein n=1 Tax=Xenorhabdus sp. TS4 TaxID=1873483 RepID=UPI002105C024|nr:hypothetical protein [Xenorhabdus sp. TS4]MBC8949402.1 propanediol utilization protein [Xenorhabdus sp. TS4]